MDRPSEGALTPEEAERLAIPFGLTYLSREGYAKLAALLSFFIKNEIKRKEAPEHLRDVACGLKIFPADALILKRKSGD